MLDSSNWSRRSDARSRSADDRADGRDQRTALLTNRSRAERTTTCSPAAAFGFPTPDAAFRRRTCIGSSSRCSPPRPEALGWGWPPARTWWKPTEAPSMWKRRKAGAASSPYACPSPVTRRRAVSAQSISAISAPCTSCSWMTTVVWLGRRWASCRSRDRILNEHKACIDRR